MEGGRSQKAEQLYVGFTCRNFGPCGAQEEEFSTELKMARDKNKNAIWAPLLSLLGLISSRRGDQDTKTRNAFIHRACLTLRALFALAFARRLKNAKKYNVSSHPVIPNIFHLNFTVIKPLKMKHDVNY